MIVAINEEEEACMKVAVQTRRINIVIDEVLDEYLQISAAARGMSVSAFVREAIQVACDQTRERKLMDAAEALASLYETDSELTAFQSLDGEDFE